MIGKSGVLIANAYLRIYLPIIVVLFSCSKLAYFFNLQTGVLGLPTTFLWLYVHGANV